VASLTSTRGRRIVEIGLVNNALLLEVDADCGYEFVLKGSVGVLIKQRSLSDARVAEAQEFDQVVIVCRVRQRHRRRTVVHSCRQRKRTRREEEEDEDVSHALSYQKVITFSAVFFTFKTE